MSAEHTHFVPQVKPDGPNPQPTQPGKSRQAQQLAADLAVANHCDESNGTNTEALSEEPWLKRFEADCAACRERGDQYYFDGENMIIVVPPDEVDEERCKAAWLAHRARPGPKIYDEQLWTGAAVFIYRYIKGKDDRKSAIGAAIREIRHIARQLSPYSLDWKERWVDALADIPQGNRREFLENLALWKPYQTVTSAKSTGESYELEGETCEDLQAAFLELDEEEYDPLGEGLT
jgi:hypothetical protein